MELQERLIWGQFVLMTAASIYFVVACLGGGDGAGLWPLPGVLLMLVVGLAVYSIGVAATSAKEPRDERTRLVEYKGYKVAYLCTMGLFTAWGLVALTRGGGLSGVAAGPVILAAWTGVEAVRTGTQLALYRASVRA